MRRLPHPLAAVALAGCNAYQCHRLVDIAEHPAEAFSSRYVWVLLVVAALTAALGLALWPRKRQRR